METPEINLIILWKMPIKMIITAVIVISAKTVFAKTLLTLE